MRSIWTNSTIKEEEVNGPHPHNANNKSLDFSVYISSIENGLLENSM